MSYVVIADPEEKKYVEVARRFLSASHEVVIASTGTEALRLIEERAPDVLFTGLLLPGKDGTELAMAVAASQRPRQTRVVIRTYMGSMGEPVRFWKVPYIDAYVYPVANEWSIILAIECMVHNPPSPKTA